jgi:CMP-N,N'-diacetyllegionaminic acid synthase
MENEEKKPGLTVAIIPARGGSKGVIGKNLRHIKGSPLIAHTIRAARRTELIDKVVVSSDDEEILAVSRANGAIAMKRPEELATDESPTEPALEYTVKTLEEQGDEIRLIVLLQCTSPLRNEQDIEDALLQMEYTNADSLLSVCPTHSFFWKKDSLTGDAIAQYDYKNRPRRQDLTIEDIVYRENGAIYITKRDILMNQHNRLGGKITLYAMPEHLSMEIDTEYDLWLAEELMTKKPLFRNE